MNQDDKRRLENQLLTMGLPALKDPALIQCMADMVNAFPIITERVDFFCDLLNECDADKRGQMYNAMKPYLHFEVPSFPECETKITYKAERMVERTRLQKQKVVEAEDKTLHLECFGCKKTTAFSGMTTADAMLQAKKSGWGRGPVPGHEFCAECRMGSILPSGVGQSPSWRRNVPLES